MAFGLMRRFSLPPILLSCVQHSQIVSAKVNHSQHCVNSMSTSLNGSKRQRRSTEQKTIGTHDGTFHCDEALACFMLRQLEEYENARIFRSRDISALREQCDIIIDVGAEFDPEKRWYDHHQKTFQETLSSLCPKVGDEFKIRLSSAGLIYAYYGERIIEALLKKHLNISLSETNIGLTFVQVYRNFICEIDGIDNGVPLLENNAEPLYKISTHISARVAKFNPSWIEDSSTVDIQERFEQAMAAVGKEFTQVVLEIGGAWIKAREYVREALVNAKSVHESGEILLLERVCPWKAHLADLEKELKLVGVPKLIIFAENENSWRVAGVPVTPSSFLGRKFLPVPWRGLRNDELSEVVGVPNLVFVHYTGFIGGALTKESAVAMAIKSIQWKNE